MELLQIKNLSFAYPGASKNAIDSVTATINSGDFILLCGETGSGKSTLLKMLKKEISPYGKKSGSILFNGLELSEIKPGNIGYVMQNPENQIVCDKVWHELSFGLENIGMDSASMHRRVAEMAGYFGLSDLMEKDTAQLSGGQKQLVNLAAVMALSPELLLLDEPTAQLDPLAVNDFVNTLRRINSELGVTVIITEHSTQEFFSLADKVAVLENGRLIAMDTPPVVCGQLRDNIISACFPTAVRLWQKTGGTGRCPLDIKGGRDYIAQFGKEKPCIEHNERKFKDTAVKCSNLYFRYGRDDNDVISGVDLTVGKGEVLSVVGANGSGKTTLVKIMSGILRQYKGKVEINGRKTEDYKHGSLYKNNVAVLPQNVQSVFLCDSVKEDLVSYCDRLGYNENDRDMKIIDITEMLGVSHLIDRHPFDLSGGEQQKCALAKLLLSQPEIIFMDEPVKSLDVPSKSSVAQIIKTLSQSGITVIIVTHDFDFAAKVSDRCVMLSVGQIVSQDAPHRFFSDNCFYTTAAARISRGHYYNAVTCDEVTELCNINGRKG